MGLIAFGFQQDFIQSVANHVICDDAAHGVNPSYFSN